MSKSQAINDARDEIVAAARSVAWYWLNQVPEDTSVEDRVNGAVFSFLVELDGCASLPACDIVMMRESYDGDISEIRVSDMLHEYFHAAR